jgi:hypothetical protein
MKRLTIILLAVATLCVGAIAFIAVNLYNKLIEERNARQTEPARMAKLAKNKIQETKTPETETTNEKEQVA